MSLLTVSFTVLAKTSGEFIAFKMGDEDTTCKLVEFLGDA